MQIIWALTVGIILLTWESFNDILESLIDFAVINFAIGRDIHPQAEEIHPLDAAFEA